MRLHFLAIGAVLLAMGFAARGQTTVFSYQGQLSSNSVPATGLYDLQFELLDTNNNLIAGPLTNAPVGVTNGIFITTLNFGSAAFDGSGRWLEIGVRNYGASSAYNILTPPQQITSVPYAIRAINASNAMVLTQPLQGNNIAGIIAVSNLPVNVVFLNSNQIFTASNTFNGVVTAGNSFNTFNGSYSGNAGGLTNLVAPNLTGTVPDARLSSNVALQSSTNIVFAGNVSATNFTGAGHGLTNVPGAFFWVTPSTTNVQIDPNVGYIATNNNSPLILLLPSSPSPGDVYKIAGVGSGGWVIAQNANQSIIAGNLSDAVGQSWTATGPLADWSAIASSADGTKLAATINNYYIYTSTNSGATWTEQIGSGNRYWSSIASSSDGTKLVAAVGYTIYNANQTGEIYVSVNSGVTWTPVTSGNLAWSSVASSANGSILVAAVRSGAIYTSTNSGSTWNAVSGTSGYQWNSVACSYDGTKIAGVDGGGYLYTSSAGFTNISSLSFSSVASSSDGSRLVAVNSSSGGIFVSTTYGSLWVQQTASVVGGLTAVASSADGSRLATTAGGSGVSGYIYGSSDSSATWEQFVGAPTLSWSDITSSSDGSILAATVYGGNIYVSAQGTTTIGTGGFLAGSQHSAIELMYVGNNQFLPLSSEGTIRAY